MRYILLGFAGTKICNIRFKIAILKVIKIFIKNTQASTTFSKYKGVYSMNILSTVLINVRIND